jgi:hypothetical protein
MNVRVSTRIRFDRSGKSIHISGWASLPSERRATSGAQEDQDFLGKVTASSSWNST